MAFQLHGLSASLPFARAFCCSTTGFDGDPNIHEITTMRAAHRRAQKIGSLVLLFIVYFVFYSLSLSLFKSILNTLPLHWLPVSFFGSFVLTFKHPIFPFSYPIFLLFPLLLLFFVALSVLPSVFPAHSRSFIQLSTVFHYFFHWNIKPFN
uniref:Uncharacterized protein n=1 Tax=Anopheles darlingi TaxID=43151 RepID=A0A2M4CVI3_ANODA